MLATQLMDGFNGVEGCELREWLKQYSSETFATRQVSIELLSWISSRPRFKARFNRSVRLKLASNRWCNLLVSAFRDNGPLSKYFVVIDNEIDFRADLDPKVVEEIEKEVSALFVPKLFAN